MRKLPDSFEHQICVTQGKLFELSLKRGYDPLEFVKIYMNSETAQRVDSKYDPIQWAGESYILEAVCQEADGLCGIKNYFMEGFLFWMGYLYRYWHYLTGESSAVIWKQSDGKNMMKCYQKFHILDSEITIWYFKELYLQKNGILM